ncbi:MAG: Rne/Rng family ribonuclease [Ignavibacteriae bacterium]|nr:Rne/Rng family ribonuclease [Ignavibacteriota bacterium]MCB9242080.1 Rne/Rng family ribonuclease [Ignavibacteriales bacterium]
MKKEIFINSGSNERRIAILEEGKLTEYFTESPENERNVGDIYLGKVAKVMKGIRAAFIDIGFQQDAFLHFSDITTSDEYYSLLGEDEFDEDDDDEEEEEQVKEPPKKYQGKRDNRYSKNPDVNLTRGQDIIVQITKEPVANKGVRVTSKVSLPGRYLVLMPFHRKVGLSRKIYNSKERYRLRKLVRSALPKGYGLIIRTVASGKEDSLILDDLNKLLSTWNEIENKVKTQKPPTILYKDVSTTSSVVRDLFKEDVSKIVIDSKKLYREIKTNLEESSPGFVKKLDLYTGNQPLFDLYNIERQIDSSLNKKVWIKGAGYIIIETTEAMTVIDVNSGKYARSSNQEVNSLNTNIEAGKEIVRQLRLRDIGGIIVIDFIDLYEEKSRRKLYDELRKEFRKDRAKATILPMSEFGLVQITRQRIRQNILHRVYDTCPLCKGTGTVLSRTSFMTNLERWIQRYKGGHAIHPLELKVNPILEAYLIHGLFSRIRKLSFKYKLRIKVEADSEISLDEFRFLSRKTGEDLTEEYLN